MGAPKGGGSSIIPDSRSPRGPECLRAIGRVRDERTWMDITLRRTFPEYAQALETLGEGVGRSQGGVGQAGGCIIATWSTTAEPSGRWMDTTPASRKRPCPRMKPVGLPGTPISQPEPDRDRVRIDQPRRIGGVFPGCPSRPPRELPPPGRPGVKPMLPCAEGSL